MKPTPAEPSIMPSIPMLMMPDRSHHRPVIAPSTIGVASTIDSSIKLVTLVLGASESASATPRIKGMARSAESIWERKAKRSNRAGRKASTAVSM